MIKQLLIYLIILFIAIGIGLALKLDIGYALVVYHHWTIWMPLWFAMLTLIITFILVYSILRLINVIRNFPKRYKDWRKHHLLKKSNLLLEHSLFKLAEGRFQEAETLLLQGVKNSNIPTIYYLCAAYTAQQRQDYIQQEEYLYKAYSTKPNKEFTISLIQAKAQLDRKQFDSALAILIRFKSLFSKQPYLLELLKETYIHLNAWSNLLKILPQLRKHKITKEENLNQLEIQAHQNLFSQKNNIKNIQKSWKHLSRKLQREPKILYAYCKQLLHFKKNEEALALITKYLYEKWDEQLVDLFGLIKTTHPERQLKTAENWLKKHNKDVILFLTLGRIAARFKHWAKAEEYLTMSLNLRKTKEAYTVLGYIYENMKKTDKALTAYRQGINI